MDEPNAISRTRRFDRFLKRHGLSLTSIVIIGILGWGMGACCGIIGMMYAQIRSLELRIDHLHRPLESFYSNVAHAQDRMLDYHQEQDVEKKNKIKADIEGRCRAARDSLGNLGYSDSNNKIVFPGKEGLLAPIERIEMILKRNGG